MNEHKSGSLEKTSNQSEGNEIINTCTISMKLVF